MESLDPDGIEDVYGPLIEKMGDISIPANRYVIIQLTRGYQSHHISEKLWVAPRFSFTCVARVARPAWASVRRLSRSSGLEASDPQGAPRKVTCCVVRVALRFGKRHFWQCKGFQLFLKGKPFFCCWLWFGICLLLVMVLFISKTKMCWFKARAQQKIFLLNHTRFWVLSDSLRSFCFVSRPLFQSKSPKTCHTSACWSID